jgi:hypothetical protein
VRVPLVAIDELPYLIECSPELGGVLQRYVADGAGPPLIVAGSAMSAMSELIASRAPLYGRAGTVVVPAPFAGGHLSALWEAGDGLDALWIDAALGGRPGYRPLVAALKRTHEIDIVALKDGRIVALGEVKLRALGEADYVRLLRIREMLQAPTATLLLASTTGVTVSSDAASELVVIEPADIYG